MKKAFASLTSFAVSATTFALAAAPAWAQQPLEWTGVCVAGPNEDVATIQGLQCLIANFLSVAITIMGLAAFVMFIYGGFKYMTSGTNTKNAESVRGTLTYAVIGIAVALASFVILQLLTQFTGVELREFIIPSSNTGLEGL